MQMLTWHLLNPFLLLPPRTEYRKVKIHNERPVSACFVIYPRNEYQASLETMENLVGFQVTNISTDMSLYIS